MAIMIATIIIILASLCRARHLGLRSIASFNAMDTMHIITACSLGNVHETVFPDYDGNIGLFSNDMAVELAEIDARNGAAGFYLSPR